eukprot:gene7421-7630_t
MEGASMYWHWRNALNLARWAACAATNTSYQSTPGLPTVRNTSLNWIVPDGWKVYRTLWQADGTPQSGKYWPLAVILTKGRSLLVLIRSTATGNDWLTNFSYNEEAGAGPVPLPGRTHAGITGVAGSLWTSGIQRALDRYVVRGSITSVSVAGHSLGAGVATIVAYMAQAYLDQKLSVRVAKVKVDAYLFAPPNVGDAVFVAAYNRMVNARRIVFQYDLIPQMPCTPTMANCNATSGNATWQYTPIGGTLLLQAADMPQQPSLWQLRKRLLLYNCYFSQFTNDVHNSCLLDSSVAGFGTVCAPPPT